MYLILPNHNGKDERQVYKKDGGVPNRPNPLPKTVVQTERSTRIDCFRHSERTHQSLRFSRQFIDSVQNNLENTIPILQRREGMTRDLRWSGKGR